MSRVLITGTSSGFGRAMVSALLERGHHVIATLRDADARKASFAAEIATYPGKLELLELDVTDAAARRRVVEQVGSGLDALVNNAGYALFGALEDTSEDQLRALFEVNFMAAALLSRDLLPALRSNKGALINMSSMFGFAAFPLTSVYCASKYALEGLSEALFHELRPHGVRVHLVEPGGHRTGFGAAANWAEGKTPAYVAQTAAYHKMKDKLESGRGRPPKGVVDRVVQLVERPSRRLRVAVGPDAVAASALKRLPDAIASATTALMYDKMMPIDSFAGSPAAAQPPHAVEP